MADMEQVNRDYRQDMMQSDRLIAQSKASRPVMPEEQQPPMEGEQPQQQKIDPKMQKEVEIFVGGISKMLHGKETKGKVYGMLKGGEPKISVPQASTLVNRMMFDQLKKKGKTPSIETLFSGVVFATSELLEIGEAGGFWKNPVAEEQVPDILKGSIQGMIEQGVKNRMIDPVELQSKIEPMLNDQQRQMGMQAAQRSGIPMEPGMSQAMEKYADDRVFAERQKMNMSQKSQQNQQQKQSMLQKAAAKGGR